MATEKYLTLSDGRTLAYEDVGDPSSSLLVIFLHGVFGVGTAPVVLSPVFIEKRAHHITPTLAGWGESSPHSPSKSYVDALTSDMTELITHLHPNTADLRIYISGGSYGSVPAQMLYGAPFDKFPLGRNIAGCLLLAPFSPFKWHKEYTKSMTWMNYISVGPPSRILPFQPLQRIAILGLSMKLRSVDDAEAMIRQLLFDHATPEEREAFARWREQRGLEEGVFERSMAKGMFKSISKSWAGFIEVSDVVHSDWGFCPDQLDDEHTDGRPMMIAASAQDDLGPDMANWLKENYKNSKLKWVPGKHLSTLYELDNLWADLLENEPSPSPAGL
ncbi:AB hydrolase-1 domain-containing protein [Mycena venus]|uniref:AB hydrolase-1 domain-containing protein n=1 Tax=Mycena venus TaxID=2733690 RepID=A0A8H6YLU4_9AGAR|nr:AB hydrolase-1 domain-containing protein [Mycena venus]